MRTYQKFETWDQVLEYVTKGKCSLDSCGIYYQAPMDYRPVLVLAKRRGNGRKVRIIPPGLLADPFWADAGHLDRFLRAVDETLPRF